MTAKNPNARHNLSPYKRGYRTIPFTPTELVDLAASVGDYIGDDPPTTETLNRIKSRLMRLHKQDARRNPYSALPQGHIAKGALEPLPDND